jgi:hypothetical protein
MTRLGAGGGIEMLTASRELDALVAEKVMGKPGRFVNRVCINGRWVDALTWISVEEDPANPSAGQFAGRMPAPYSTDIAAAWAVVEKLMMQDIWIAMCPYSFHAQPVGWFVEYFIDKDKKGGEIEAATATLAICLAALKAVGYEAKP